MSVDKFGRYRGRIAPARGPPGVGFVLTAEGDFNMRNKRMKNIKQPYDAADAATKAYVDSERNDYINVMKKMTVKQEKLRDEHIKDYQDTKHAIVALIHDTIPQTVNSRIRTVVDPVLKRVKELKEDLEKYVYIVDAFRKDFEEFRRGFEEFQRTVVRMDVVDVEDPDK